MKRTFATALLASMLAFGLVTSAWSADTGSTTAPSGSTTTKKHKQHAKKHTKGKKDDSSQTQK